MRLTPTQTRFLKPSILDAFSSPRQNVLGIQYLSRIRDESDQLGLEYDFFTFNFDEQIHHGSAKGVVYGFPPKPLELTACRHIMTFKPRCWVLVLSGGNLTEAMQILQGRYVLHFERFAIKANKLALRARAPSYLLMLLFLKPKQQTSKRVAANDVCDVSRKVPR